LRITEAASLFASVPHISPHHLPAAEAGFRESATVRRIDSDQKLNVEGIIGGNENSNIEEGFGSEC
jgi:hypothetical protein